MLNCTAVIRPPADAAEADVRLSEIATSDAPEENGKAAIEVAGRRKARLAEAKILISDCKIYLSRSGKSLKILNSHASSPYIVGRRTNTL